MCASKIYNGVNCNIFWYESTTKCILGTVEPKSGLIDNKEEAAGFSEVRVLNVKKGLP